MGVGDIGSAIGRVAKAFGSRVVGLVRGKSGRENLDAEYTMEDLPSFLSSCDYVVNVLPSTPSTRGLLNGGVLKNIKQGSVFINVGRGMSSSWIICFSKNSQHRGYHKWTRVAFSTQSGLASRCCLGRLSAGTSPAGEPFVDPPKLHYNSACCSDFFSGRCCCFVLWELDTLFTTEGALVSCE